MSSQRCLIVFGLFLLLVYPVFSQQQFDLDAMVQIRSEIEGSLFYPLPSPCSLFSLEGTTAGAPIALMTRGENLSAQGGSETGCGIPDDATALMIQLRMESQTNLVAQMKLWLTDKPEPVVSLLDTSPNGSESTLTIIPLDISNLNGEVLISSSDWIVIEGLAVGYFRKSDVGYFSTGDISFHTESDELTTTNNLFGYKAGKSTTGKHNSFFGHESGYSNSAGYDNSFFGSKAGYYNTIGRENTFIGSKAGYKNTEGANNTFVGFGSGENNTIGNMNSFFGTAAGSSNTEGYSNSFYGWVAGQKNTTGHSNSFFGLSAGWSNTEACCNSFFGKSAGHYAEGGFNSFFGRGAGSGDFGGIDNTGYHNAFFGNRSGYNNTTGFYGAFFGSRSGFENTTGFRNSFFGFEAGQNNTEGNYNSFFGFHAGGSNTIGVGNAFFGEQSGLSNTTEDNNSFFGSRSNGKAGITNATAIGHRATVGQSNSLVLGSVAGVNGAGNNVNVGIGVTKPLVPLHVQRADGTAQVLIRENSTTPKFRNLLELNNLGPVQFHLINREIDVDWTLRNNYKGEFRIETAPLPKAQFVLQEDGDLLIQGNLRAKGIWYTSDRNSKENFEPVDSETVLAKLVSLPILKWNFKSDSVRHIGPMAQDFHATFNLGNDKKHLNPTDTTGVTISAIQALYQRLVEKDQEIESLKARVAELESIKAELAEIRRLVNNSVTADD